jgi:hypothetical protein
MSERFNYSDHEGNDEPIGYIEKYIGPPILPKLGPQHEWFQSLLKIAASHSMSAEEVYKMVTDTFFIFENRFNELGQSIPEQVQNGGNIFIANEHAEDELSDVPPEQGIKDLTPFLEYVDSTHILITTESENGGQYLKDFDLKNTENIRITKDDHDNS